MARLSPGDAWSGWLGWCWSITRTTGTDEAGQKNINWKYFHVLQIYRGCQHVLCDFINSWGTNSFDNCYEIFVWHRSEWWQADNDKWPDQCTPGTLTKIFLQKKYLISQQIVGITIQYWVYTKVCYYGAWCWAWPITIAAYLGPDPILMTVING